MKIDTGSFTLRPAGEQLSLRDASFGIRTSKFVICVFSARNGHVVSILTRPDTEPDPWLVPEDSSITDTIAAAIAAYAMERT